MKNSGKDGPFWVCSFSIYQSNGDGEFPTIGQQLGDDPEYGPFATVLKGAESMVAVVTWECDIYGRLWYVLFQWDNCDFYCCICIAMEIASNILRHVFVVVDVTIILVFHRCVYEMHIAQKLQKEVFLCPYVDDYDIYCGDLDADVCIANIKTPVNSRDAKCGQESDTNIIHKAILAESDKGFEKLMKVWKALD